MNNATSFDHLPLALTVNELAEVLNIGLSSAYALVRSGQIYALRIGKQYRIPKDSLIAFLSGQERELPTNSAI